MAYVERFGPHANAVIAVHRLIDRAAESMEELTAQPFVRNVRHKNNQIETDNPFATLNTMVKQAS